MKLKHILAPAYPTDSNKSPSLQFSIPVARFQKSLTNPAVTQTFKCKMSQRYCSANY